MPCLSPCLDRVSEGREPRAAEASFDAHNAEKKVIRLGKGDKKDKETEVTWFCSWLSDAEAEALA